MRMMGGYEDLTPGRAAEDVEALRMRAVHIIDTSPGELPQDPEWGWGARNYLGTNLGAGDLELIGQIGRAAFRRDPEVQDATVSIAQTSPGRATIRPQLSTTLGAVIVEREIS